METHERVKFRLIQMPCCGQLLCWVNPRLPCYCPECGENVIARLLGCELVIDDNAWLTLTGDKNGQA